MADVSLVVGMTASSQEGLATNLQPLRKVAASPRADPWRPTPQLTKEISQWQSTKTSSTSSSDGS
jgi:hypothetical protein